MPDTAPLVEKLTRRVPAQGTAGTVQDFVIGEAPFTGEVSSVSIIPDGDVTADGTNFRTIRVVNTGDDGTGTTEVASLPLDTTPADDLTEDDEKAIPLSGTAANLDVTEGDVLQVDETVTGTGLAHSGYLIQVEISRGQD